jgi:hypothetical protein
MPHQESHVHLNCFEAALIARLCQVARGAVTKERAWVGTFGEFEINALNLLLQTLFRLLLSCPTHAQADANTAMALIDEPAAVGACRDSASASRSHEFLHSVRRSILGASGGMRWGGVATAYSHEY